MGDQRRTERVKQGEESDHGSSAGPLGSEGGAVVRFVRGAEAMFGVMVRVRNLIKCCSIPIRVANMHWVAVDWPERWDRLGQQFFSSESR